MNRSEDRDNTIRSYLLGELSEPERAALESEYFSDREKFEEMYALENDLIDDYVRGSLPAAEREQFERRYFSSAERVRRVQFAASMLSSLYGIPGTSASEVKRPESAPPRFWSALAGMFVRRRLVPAPLLASLSLILTLAVVLLGLECLRLRQALTASRETLASQSQRERELQRQLVEQRAGSSQLERDLEALRDQQAHQQNRNSVPAPGRSPVVAAFTLRPELIRGFGEPQRLLVPPEADAVEFRLNLKAIDFEKYSATLSTTEGRVLSKLAEVRVHPSQSGGRVVVRVPAKLLPPGDYILRVDGTSPSGEPTEVIDSYFQIAAKAAP